MLKLNSEATSQGHSSGCPYPPGAYPGLPSRDLQDHDVALKEAIPDAPCLVRGLVELLYPGLMCVGTEHVILHKDLKSNIQTSLVLDVALTTTWFILCCVLRTGGGMLPLVRRGSGAPHCRSAGEG
jgi:hypothetical protein